MDDKTKALFVEYAQLRAVKEQTEERIATLVGQIVPAMLDIDGKKTKVETSLGNFTIRENATWTYPQEVVDGMEAVKKAKAETRQNGMATKEVNFGLNYTPIKTV